MYRNVSLKMDKIFPKYYTTNFGLCKFLNNGYLFSFDAVFLGHPVVPYTGEKCKEITFGDSETKICAFREGTDSCQGDSGKKSSIFFVVNLLYVPGGPLFIEHDGVFTQLGIVSYGYGCATDYPGVYTRLERYTDWVRNVTAAGTPAQVQTTLEGLRASAQLAVVQAGSLLVVLVLLFLQFIQ